jgi:hypothetical protein
MSYVTADEIVSEWKSHVQTTGEEITLADYRRLTEAVLRPTVKGKKNRTVRIMWEDQEPENESSSVYDFRDVPLSLDEELNKLY